MSSSHKPPFKEMLQAIPGFFGIRLEEEPTYEVVEAIGDVEIRRYQPVTLAQVTVPGPHDQAMDAAFEKLADYIFGGNERRREMSMTTPVVQRPSGETMSMTTPVRQQAAGDGWTVAFFLANGMSPDEAPKPDDPAIEIVQQPAMLVGALRYTGNNDDEARLEAKRRLLATLAGEPRWVFDSEVSWAQYDQPFAIPFLKRNEAHVALVDDASSARFI